MDLSEIKKEIRSRVPITSMITEIEYEGPEIVVYAKNPGVLMENGDTVRELAKTIRKRIIIRPDPSVLTPPEEAEEKIRELVPAEAEITRISFDPSVGDVVIEAKKPGLVIGKSGQTLRDITKKVRWRARVIRTPPLSSEIIDGIRHMLRKESEERKTILRNIGRRIHREKTANTDWIRLTALGGFREVGRSALYLQTPESKVLLDFGVNVASEENAFPYVQVPEFRIGELDAVVVSHAHLDHSGLVPLLFKYGYTGPVYCTPPTLDLMTLLQFDYIDVAEKEGKTPPYEKKHVKEMIMHTIPLNYGEVTDIAPDIRITLHNAGHILGSAITHIHIGDGLYNIVYTADFKFEKTKLLERAMCNFPRVETLILESTYGGADDIQPTREDADHELIRIIKETLRNGGKVLIPVLGVGRAQEIMVLLDEKVSNAELDKDLRAYVDGMITKANAIHTGHPNYLGKEIRHKIFHEDQNPFLSEIFEVVDGSEARQDILDGEPAVILATSGMMVGGPVLEYFRHLAGDPKNALVFVSYQAEGTLGRRLQKGWKEVQLPAKNGKPESVRVNMQIHTVEGFSGHSDRSQLLNYVRRIKPSPERIITNHGENNKCVELSSALYKLFRTETRAPLNLETIRLK